MAAEALIVEDAYQRGYADAIADMRKKKEQRRQREQAKKARRWYSIKQKAYGLAMLAVTVLAAWATEGDITIQRIKKLQALAERSVGGEKTTAQKKLAKLLKDNGINSLDELQKEEYEYTIFSYNGKHEIKLLRQCMYKVMGAKSDRTAYKPYGRRQKIGIYCTKAQKIEIELEFEFYRNVFYEELSTFMDAFIQAQKIFPEDAPVGDYDEFNERDMKIAFMATGIERRSRAAMIEESEAGNEKTKTTGS